MVTSFGQDGASYNLAIWQLQHGQRNQLGYIVGNYLMLLVKMFLLNS